MEAKQPNAGSSEFQPIVFFSDNSIVLTKRSGAFAPIRIGWSSFGSSSIDGDFQIGAVLNHASSRVQEALFDISNGQVIGGALPRKTERIVADWIELRRADLLDNWERGRLHKAFNQVPGADVE